MDWAPQATPQTAEEVHMMPNNPEVVEMASKRDISSIVHFTRIRGLVGILDSSEIKPRSELPLDARLKHIYQPNAEDRSRDHQWHDYINLSISQINMRMLNFSQREHPNEKWVILELSPELLGDPGVIFCTTNNAYDVVHRCAGLRGFEQMFASKIPWGHYDSVCTRSGRKYNQTTDPQAEVLYPFKLSTDYLHTITINDEETEDMVVAALSHYSQYANIRLNVNTKAFQ